MDFKLAVISFVSWFENPGACISVYLGPERCRFKMYHLLFSGCWSSLGGHNIKYSGTAVQGYSTVIHVEVAIARYRW